MRIENIIGIIRIAFICLFIISNSEAQVDINYIYKIEKEAKELKRNKAEYQNYLQKEDSLFQLRETDIENGMHVAYWPDLSLLNAPLAYYHIRLQDNSDRCYFYITDGIPLSSDIENRQNFLLYIQSKKETIYNSTLSEIQINWNHYLSLSGNSNWANEYISSIKMPKIESNFKKTLPYIVINHWANSLNHRNKSKAYNYVKSLYGANPSNAEDNSFFHLFYRLKPKKTQNELVKYWDQDEGTSNYSIIMLLSKFNSKNTRVANKLTKIKSKCDSTDYIIDYINTALFYLNPKQGKKDMTNHLEKDILGIEAYEDYYSDPKKVLKSFAEDMCKKADELDILTKYVKSEPIHTSGDIHRYWVLEEINKKSVEHYKKLIIELKEKEIETGKAIIVLQWAENKLK